MPIILRGGLRGHVGDAEFAPPSSWVMPAVGTLRASQAERWVCSSPAMMQRWQRQSLPPPALSKFCQFILTRRNSYCGPGKILDCVTPSRNLVAGWAELQSCGLNAGFVQVPLLHLRARGGTWSHLAWKQMKKNWGWLLDLVTFWCVHSHWEICFFK